MCTCTCTPSVHCMRVTVPVHHTCTIIQVLCNVHVRMKSAHYITVVILHVQCTNTKPIRVHACTCIYTCPYSEDVAKINCVLSSCYTGRPELT